MKSLFLLLRYFSVLLLILVSCFSMSAKSINDTISNKEIPIFDEIETVITFGKKYLGKPYRYRTTEGRILDCSGFVSYIYKEIGIILPRSAPAIANVSKKTDLSKVEKGDLLFFKGRDIGNRSVGHVAMVVSVDGNQIEMMHSCNSGIKIEKYNGNRYYTSRLLFAAKVPQLDEIDDTPVDEIETVEEKSIQPSESKAIQMINNDFTIINFLRKDGPYLTFCQKGFPNVANRVPKSSLPFKDEKAFSNSLSAIIEKLYYQTA